MDDFNEKGKKFVITRGMILLLVLLVIVLVLIVVFLKPKKNNSSSITVSDCKKLEERIKEETPMYIYQKNIELTSEPIRIEMTELLSKNGGTINESKYKASKVCKGYSVAVKKNTEDIKAYITCGKIYTTDGYANLDNNPVSTTTKQDDTQAPVITIIGDAELQILVGDDYKDPGAKALDNLDGDISSRIKVSGTVDTSKAGIYVIKYSVIDDHSNEAYAERKVIVQDNTTTTTTTTAPPPLVTTTTKKNNYTTTTKKVTNAISKPPLIIIRGDKEESVSYGSVYVDKGATATDYNGEDITSRMTTSGSVNTSAAGTYVITYSVTDKYGNGASSQRTVTVSKLIEIKSISITPNSTSLTIGKTKKLELSVSPKNASNKNITWSSSDISVVTVDSSGVITGKKRGTATITAKTINGKKASSRITVK